MTLAIIVPTRGRPDATIDMARSFARTATAYDTSLFFVIDHDDPQIEHYLRKREPLRNIFPTTELLFSPWGTQWMSVALNGAAMDLWEHFDYLGFMGDDHRPRTQNWDSHYQYSLRQGNMVVYGNDLLQGEAIATQCAMQSGIPGALGYMAPPGFRHLCLDLVWMEWGKALNGLRYLPDVVVEHMHPAAGKAVLDEGYKRVNAHDVATGDTTVFYDWQENILPGEIEILKEWFGR